jgi:hypothetical protein
MLQATEMLINKGFDIFQDLFIEGLDYYNAITQNQKSVKWHVIKLLIFEGQKYPKKYQKYQWDLHLIFPYKNIWR